MFIGSTSCSSAFLPVISGNDIIIECNEGVRTIRPPTKVTDTSAIRETSALSGSSSAVSISAPGLILRRNSTLFSLICCT